MARGQHGAAVAHGEPARRRRRAIAIWSLAIGQTIGYASLYYIFAALLLTWERDLGWSKAELTFPFAMSILVVAAAGPFVGRLIDLGLGRWSLGLGGFIGAVALGALAFASTPLMFLAIWLVIGVAHAACLYEACFSIIIRALGSAARGTITRITLVAGFASPIAFPAGAALAGTLGWQGAVLVFAVAMGLVAAPLLFVGVSLLEADGDEPIRTEAGKGGAIILRALRHPAFWLIAAAFAAAEANHGMLLAHIIPLLVDRGLSDSVAVTVASVVGPMQVVGRVAMMRFERHIDDRALTLAASVGVAVASALLLIGGASIAMAVAFAAIQGAAHGVKSILKPLITAQYLGRAGFGAIAGIIAMPGIVAAAAGPYLGALLWQAGGYDLVIGAGMVLGLVGVGCVVWLITLPPQPADPRRGTGG